MKDAAAHFVWLTARVIDQRRFAYLFADGTADGVQAALAAYRNPDGGYGWALEPDGRGPVSQPVHVLTALEILDEIGRVDPSIADHLAATQTADGGTPITLPDIGPYPRAPWWPVTEEPAGSLLPTASLVALLIRNKVAHPYVDRAAAFCRAAIAGTTATHPYEAGAIVRFLDAVGDEDEAARIGRMVRAARLVLIDPDRPQEIPTPEGYAEGEMHRPYDYAPTPDSLARRWFSDAEMETALDGLQAEQEADGGWPIHFRAWAPGITLEWRPVATIHALKVLRAYGRI
jgi:hypothetical protein